ncbi:helix-turn-helix domain-containing protein [Flavobacterium sp.]|uniref:helix-turn-helix domain-containing protein n=1 Tax=Flavobacterium sp. TaxID=239 RepID=UPI003752786E
MLILFFLIATNLYVAIEKDIEFLKKFGKRLKQLRQEKGISQAQLSYEADIQISQISRIERGLINTTIANTKLLSKILEIPLKDFFDFE